MTSEAIVLWTETSSDPELIAGVRAGDAAAFGVLYERHVGAARKVAAQYTNSASDIDDVVSESFSRVLRALQRGDGPDLAFRAYLFTIVRRTGLDIINKGIRTKPRDDMSPYESAIGYEASSDEPAIDSFEQGVVADAFKSLPERWQAVLWYTEVEKKTPKEIAPLLGLSANGVAALAYRAREALRQAYLQQHLNTAQSAACLEANSQLGAFVRGGLSKRENTKVEAHVQECEKCAALVAELQDVNHGMRAVIAPLFMGVLGVGALKGGLPIGGAFSPHGASAGGAGAGSSGGTATGAGGVSSLGSSSAAGFAGVAGATGLAGKGSASSGITGLFGAVSQVALPAAAVVGVTALAIGGASLLGWFSPDTESNLTEGSDAGSSDHAPLVPGDTDSSAADPEPTEPADDNGDVETGDEEGAEGDTSANPDATRADDPPAWSDDASPGGATGIPASLTDPAPGSDAAPSAPGTAPSSPAEQGGIDDEPAGTRDEGDEAGDSNDDEDAGDDGGVDDPPVSPEDPAQPEPKPVPQPPSPPLSAAFSIGKSALDYMEISRTSPQVSMTVANSGEAPANDVTAQITLPAGLEVAPPLTDGSGMAGVAAKRLEAHVAFATDGTFSAGEWECGTDSTATVATCTLAHLEVGDRVTLTLPVTIVAEELTAGAQTHFVVTAGDITDSYSVATALAARGGEGNPLDPGYTNTGGESVAHFGGTVMGCEPEPLPWSSCYTAMINTHTPTGQRLSNNDWNMVELKPDPHGTNVGVTHVALPEDVTIKAAYLEWSANRFVDPNQPHNHAVTDGWTSDVETVQVKLDSGEFVTVTADERDDTTVEENREYYLARADVTNLFADRTSATLTVADVAVASSRLEQAVHTYYGGFTLTVVYEDPGAHKDTRVALFTGPHWVKGSAPVTISFLAQAGERVTPSWTAYEGDRGNKGDRVSLGGDSFVPLAVRADGTIERRDSGDAADSWANGSVWTNTLGIDANSFDSKVLSSSGRHDLRAATDGDNFMIGTLAVTIAPPATDD